MDQIKGTLDVGCFDSTIAVESIDTTDSVPCSCLSPSCVVDALLMGRTSAPEALLLSFLGSSASTEASFMRTSASLLPPFRKGVAPQLDRRRWGDDEVRLRQPLRRHVLESAHDVAQWPLHASRVDDLASSARSSASRLATSALTFSTSS